MITNYKIFKENILKPTSSIEDKLEKVQVSNKELLMTNEKLTFDETFYIDETWDFDLDPKLIKTKKINNNVVLNLERIPNWLSNIKINGNFSCSWCNLTTLKNCPKIINGYFSCTNNELTSLEDGPTYVFDDYYCKDNITDFTEEYVRSICEVGHKVDV